MKGLELPLSLVTIIIIAAVVLTTLGFFFLSQSSSLSAAGIDQLHSEGCIALRAAPFECNHADVNSVNVGSGANKMSLGSVCASKGIRDSVACAKSCLCDVSGAGNAITLSKPQVQQSGGGGLNLIAEVIDEEGETA